MIVSCGVPTLGSNFKLNEVSMTCISLKSVALAALAVAAGAAQANMNLVFQEGLNSYVGTIDTNVRSAAPGTAYGADTFVSVDGDDGSPGLQPNHGLVRFSNLFGSGPGQINPLDTINSATLTVRVFNPGSGMALHDMLTSWNSSSTWNSMVGGIQANGTEASLAQLVTVGANNGNENVPVGLLNFNVTLSLVGAQSGSLPGLGWAMLPFTNGTNGIDFYTSEFGTVASRPLLTVNVTPVPEPGTWALLAVGLGVVVFLARRRTV